MDYFFVFLAGIFLCWLACYVYWTRQVNAARSAEREVGRNLKIAQEKNAKLDDEIESLNKNLSDTTEKLKKATGELKEAQKSMETLTAQAEEAQKAQADLQKELKACQEKSTALETEAADLKSQIEALQSAPTEVCIDPDDLRKIEGIGPKIADILRAKEIRTFAQLAQTEVSDLQAFLDEAGPNFKINDPHSWPAQAKLAADEDWEGLQKLQDELSGGR